jgi:hypothetical protein
MPNGSDLSLSFSKGTGTSTEETLTDLSDGSTLPFIYIKTTLAGDVNSVSLQFEYLPESVSFGVSALFQAEPIAFTSARWLSYQHSDIEEVSLAFKVVAGCNNCITRAGANTSGSNYINFSVKTATFVRNSLIDIAKLLYSLPLPGTNEYGTGAGGNSGVGGLPPPTVRLIVGKMFSGIGAMTGCSIQFNGPYDFDGSPTDMDVSLRFLPSEFYNGSTMDTGIMGLPISSQQPAQPGTGDIGKNPLVPVSTPTGETEVTGMYPYALAFGETNIAASAAGINPVTGAPTVQPGGSDAFDGHGGDTGGGGASGGF